MSDDGGNCGRPLTCGATPEGIGFAMAGEVDSFMLSLTAGQDDQPAPQLHGRAGRAVACASSAPDGKEMLLEGRCAGQITIHPPIDGIYTALVERLRPSGQAPLPDRVL